MSDIQTGETSLTIRRTFEAPRDRVFRAFIEPAAIEAWQSIGGLSVEVHEIEAEPGGSLSMTHAPGEERFRFDGEFLEVVDNEKLVYTLQVVEGPFTDDDASLVTVEFSDVDGGCEIAFTEERVDPEMLDDTVATWNRMLGQLPEAIRLLNEIETTDTSLTIRRTFDAPRDRVWEAWTDADQIDNWWGPDGFTTTTDEMDVTPGGVWAFQMVGPDGEKFPNRVVYDEVERLERLAYTHGSPDDPEQFEVTVTFEEESQGETLLTMKMRFPSASDLDEAIEFGADQGAQQTLGKLADHLAANVGDA